MLDKKLTYEEEDAWLREIQLGERTDLPDGRSVEQAREDIHSPKNSEEVEAAAYKQALDGLMKLSKDDLLKKAENVGLTEFTDKTKKEDIAKAILEKAKEVGEVQ